GHPWPDFLEFVRSSLIAASPGGSVRGILRVREDQNDHPWPDFSQVVLAFVHERGFAGLMMGWIAFGSVCTRTAIHGLTFNKSRSV
ncbi:MAG TPA: hypothetical protein VIG31_01800, partial [Rhodanobacteraceae bacterium]